MRVSKVGAVRERGDARDRRLEEAARAARDGAAVRKESVLAQAIEAHLLLQGDRAWFNERGARLDRR